MTRGLLAISGVGGFIGAAAAEAAQRAGWRVRGLELSTAGAAAARAAGVDEVLVGDVTDPDDQARLCRGADAVLHAAARVREGGPMGAFWRVNVDACAGLAHTAHRLGVERLVHLSSIMVYGFDPPPFVTEDGPLCDGATNPYCVTKLAGERAVMRRHAPGHMEVVVLRPGDVYGPRSVPWVLRPLELMRQRLFVLPDGGCGRINPVHIDDLTRAILLALTTPETGLAYNITDGTSIPARAFFAHHLAMLGRAGPIPTLPASALRPAFALLDRGARALGVTPPVSAASLDFVNKSHGQSIRRARARLGYTPRVELDEGMRRVRHALFG